MRVYEIKAMLEYLLSNMEGLDTAEACRAKVQNAIDLCVMRSIEQLSEEFGLI